MSRSTARGAQLCRAPSRSHQGMWCTTVPLTRPASPCGMCGVDSTCGTWASRLRWPIASAHLWARHGTCGMWSSSCTPRTCGEHQDRSRNIAEPRMRDLQREQRGGGPLAADSAIVRHCPPPPAGGEDRGRGACRLDFSQRAPITSNHQPPNKSKRNVPKIRECVCLCVSEVRWEAL